MRLSESLLNSDKLVGVWGIGYIGFSSMAYFAANGVRTLGVDVDEKKVNQINKGQMPLANMEYWLGFDTLPLVKSGMMAATLDWEKLIDNNVGVHLICIPTEKDEKPYDEILQDVIKKLAIYSKTKPDEPPLIIIESTLTPGRTDQAVIPLLEKQGLNVGEDILVGVAPRRDWFISPEKSMKTLPRVVGGTTTETTEAMVDVLGLVCDTILPAKDHKHAELVKSIENAFRHVEITLANQLSLAYPEVDMREVLKFVGTKWNIGTYHPSFGTGGYCIPLSSQYVLLGTENKETLSILSSTIETDQKLPYLLAESVVKSGARKVGILGLAYKADLKIHTLSPAIRITQYLKGNGISVKVHDPYYSAKEIRDILDVETFEFPTGLKEFDTILVVSDHREYYSTPQKLALDNMKNCKLILNNTELWSGVDFQKLGIKHHIAGTVDWLKTGNIK